MLKTFCKNTLITTFRIAIFGALVLILSCSRLDKGDKKRFLDFDPNTGFTQDETKHFIKKDNHKTNSVSEEENKSYTPKIPKISNLTITPPAPVIGGTKLITLSITDQVSIKDVLVEVGRIANIDIDIDPDVSGSVIINANNRPLKEVLDRIASMAGLRYSYKNNVLHFEPDSPYVESYFVDYLNGSSIWGDVETGLSNVISAVKVNTKSEVGISSNKSAGIISIYATEQQHRAAKKYLAEVESTASLQVLIEAKIIDVTLNDQYKTGIDWSFTGGTVTNGGVNLPIISVFSNSFVNSADATLNALKQFGITKALSSPRIHAINNQTSQISFTTKNVYFNVTNTQTSTTQSNNVVATATSTKVEQETGITLEITPSVNINTDEITMSIKPELSAVSEYVDDPVNTGNRVPVITSKSLETKVKIKNGNAIIIGGLMTQDDNNQDSGAPFIQSIPLLGWLFRSITRTSKVVETVIFIKATIIDSDAAPDQIDRAIQEKYDVNKRTFFEN